MARILVVDDEESTRMLLRQVFIDAGHEVMLANNGREALETLNTVLPDAMIIDIVMPQMTGPEFAENLRRLALRRPELAAIPYVVMTGQNYTDEITSFGFAKDRSFVKFIPKMAPVEEILDSISAALRRIGK